MKQFSVVQPKIMKMHSKNQDIMSSTVQTDKSEYKQQNKFAKEIFGLIRRLVKQYLQKLVISFLIF